jgi:hypothetical protein
MGAVNVPDPSWAPTSFRPWVYQRDDYWAAVQMAANRMCVSETKYGPLENNYPAPADALATLRERLQRYEETGNTEWLLDVANMAVIEHLFPSHPEAHFRATGSEESPGLRQR